MLINAPTAITTLVPNEFVPTFVPLSPSALAAIPQALMNAKATLRLYNGTTSALHVTQGGSIDSPDFAMVPVGESRDLSVAGAASMWSATSGTIVVLAIAESSTSMGASVAAAARAASLSRSATDRATNPSTIESWADLSRWALYGGSGDVQVSGGRLYSADGAGGGNTGMNRAFAVPANGRFTIVAQVRLVANASGAGIMIGLDHSAPGAAPSQYTASARGFYFGDALKLYQEGDAILVTGGDAPADDYVFTMVGDGSGVSFSVRGVSTGFESRGVMGYATFNNVYVFCVDSRGLNGHSVGKLGFKLGMANLPPTDGLTEMRGISVVNQTVNGRAIRVAFPPGYDSSVGAPVVICHHGDGSTEGEWGSGEANPFLLANELNYAGYIVLSATAANHRTWGSNAGVEAYNEAYKYLAANFGFGKVAMYGLSMGGVESLNGLASREIPEIVAWAGQSPVASLATAYGNGAFTAAIQAAYGMDGGNDDYAEKTAGHDPLLLPGHAFRGVPMYGLAASDDTYVPAAQNWDALKTLVAPYAKEIKELVPKPTGGHAFDITPYLASIVAWFDKYAK